MPLLAQRVAPSRVVVGVAVGPFEEQTGALRRLGEGDVVVEVGLRRQAQRSQALLGLPGAVDMEGDRVHAAAPLLDEVAHGRLLPDGCTYLDRVVTDP